MIDVYFYEVFEEEEKLLRKYLPQNISVQYSKKTVQEENTESAPASLISIRTQSVVPPGWAGALKGILTRSQGYDHLLKFRRETKTRAVCGYLDNYCSRSVAEHAILSMMTLQKKLKRQIQHFETFNRDHLTGVEWNNKNVLVVGVGNIGIEIVRLVKGLGMNVKGIDIKKKHKDVSYVSLESGLLWADVVFCALPFTDETENILDYNCLKKAKSGVIFINVGRGEVCCARDLKKLLDEKVLGGLALDVYPNESRLARKLRANEKLDEEELIIFELKDRNNVLFTPHNAFNTQESVERKARDTARAVMHFLKHKTFLYTISG